MKYTFSFCNGGILLVGALLFFPACKQASELGKASYYADKFEGRKTANGETFHQSSATAAHKTLPFGTKVKVKNLDNGKKVTVRINDRGPFVAGRIIDLSRAAAKEVGLVQSGVANVKITYKKKRKR